ncbi:hypothetical protein G6F37_007353 [Rhizopus arrhizus]|nr:hypothetical protein G6F38_007507 [Rhizopus arrhizus]KAG1156723.1 hypothetical protein G6F37_007353 [Rhizopus arrhizus]
MEVDDPNFPLGDVTDFNTYHDLKRPEKLKGECTESSGNRLKSPNFSESEASTLKTYLNEKGMSVRSAAKQLKIPSSTAFCWQQKSLEVSDDLSRENLEVEDLLADLLG